MFFQFNAVNALYDSGCIIVAAAGNDGIKNEKNQFPANSPGVLSISAFDESDQMAALSNGGPNIKFGAPGVLIRSTWPKNLYETLDGTSMATSHVAGIVSLALANYRIIHAILQHTTQRLTNRHRSCRQRFKRLIH